MLHNPIQIILIYFTKLFAIFLVPLNVGIEDRLLACDTVSIFFRDITLRVCRGVIYFSTILKKVRVFGLYGLFRGISRRKIHWLLIMKVDT